MRAAIDALNSPSFPSKSFLIRVLWSALAWFRRSSALTSGRFSGWGVWWESVKWSFMFELSVSSSQVLLLTLDASDDDICW